MSYTEEDLRNLLRDCTVRINTPSGHGTGFFVGESLVLTCRHVVQREAETFATDSLDIVWKDRPLRALSADAIPLPGPDLALIRLACSPDVNHPCTWLFSDIGPGDNIFTFGFPENFESGGPSTFQYEGTFTEKSGHTAVKLKEGQANFGLSGSAALNTRTRSVCAVMYYSDDPTSALGARVVPVCEAIKRWSEIPDQQESFHKSDLSWVSFLPIYSLQRNEASIRERLYRAELFERESNVPSPLYPVWHNFLDSEPWHEWVASKCDQIRRAAERIKEGPRLSALVANVDLSEPYDSIVSALRAVCLKVNDVREWVERYQEARDVAEQQLQEAKDKGLVSHASYERLQEAKEAVSHARSILRQLLLIEEELKQLHFSTCFLVTGTLGSGKTHFLATTLNESVPNPYVEQIVLPVHLLENKDTAFEKVVVEEASRCAGMTWDKLSDLNRYLGSLDKPCKLVIAVDGPNSSVQHAQVKALTRLIADSTACHQIRWLFEIGLHDYPRFSSLSKTWSEYGFRGRRSDEAHPNIGGWLTLDDVNRVQQLGIQLIKVFVPAVAKSEPLLKSLPLVSPATREHLTNPFVAWAFIDVHEDLAADTLINTNFIEFVSHFWKTLVARMSHMTDRPDLFEQSAVMVASYYLGASTHPAIGELIDFMNQHAGKTPELQDPFVARNAITGLARANLLDLRTDVTNEFVPDDLVARLNFPVFWQWAIARLILQHRDFTSHRASNAVAYLERWFSTRSPDRVNKEGILEFFLLLIDQWGQRGERDRKFVKEVWRTVFSSRQLPEEAVWFSAPKAAAQTQTMLAEKASEQGPKLSSGETGLFSFMYFCTEARIEAVDVPTRFALLQPLYPNIKESLTEYFSYIVFRLFPQIDNRESWIKTMGCLEGVEILGITQAVAQSALERLIELESSREAQVDVVVSYLSNVKEHAHNTQATPWVRTFFYEWVVFSFLNHLLEHAEYGDSYVEPDVRNDARNIYELLKRAGWYDGKHFTKEVAFSIRREANIAFGFWYRTSQNASERESYHRLIDFLLSSSVPRDRETAFFLIRHSEPTGRAISVVVDKEFGSALERLAIDSELGFIHDRYADFFRANKIFVRYNDRPKRAPKSLKPHEIASNADRSSTPKRPRKSNRRKRRF